MKDGISIKRNEHLTKHVFKGHVDSIVDDYGRVIMVNLVKKKKADECKLTESLMKLLELHPNRNLKHIWYDFHGETHGDQFHKINDLM